MQPGIHTRQEILSQPEAWADALEQVEKSRFELDKILQQNFRQVIFTGCGSTYYLSLSAAALFQKATGKSARAVPAGELLFNPATIMTSEKTLLVAISRSGSTSETVRAVEQFKKNNQGPVIAVTNYGDQPLAGLADLAIVIPKGQEESIAQTRSFASMFVAVTALTSIASGQEDKNWSTLQKLPEIGQKIITNYEPLARELGENLGFDRFYFLGSGPRYGLACEANLKMKEMTLTHSEPFHFLEFRHGPMAMVTGTAVVVGMLSDSNRTQEQKVLDEMAALGGNVIGLGESDARIAFHSGLAESVRSVLYLPALQLMACYRSLAKGLDPDRPTNLTAVVTLNLP